MSRSFPIGIGPRSRLYLRLWGVTPSRSRVELNGDVDVLFGFFRFRAPMSAIERWRIEGPWLWITAIGIRMSLRHRDISFCGDPRGGVRVDFREPVRWGPLRVPAVYLCVEDLEGLAAELSRRGIPGEDRRRGR